MNLPLVSCRLQCTPHFTAYAPMRWSVAELFYCIGND